jgi:hypothetical protein
VMIVFGHHSLFFTVFPITCHPMPARSTDRGRR